MTNNPNRSSRTELLLALLLGLGVGALAATLVLQPWRSEARAVAAAAGDDSPLVLEVGEEGMTLAEFEERWRQLTPRERAFYAEQASEQHGGSAREVFLGELVDEILLAREARRRGFAARLDVRAASRAAEHRALAAPLLVTEVRDAALPESELRAWYDANRDALGEPARVQVSEIVVTSAPGGPTDDTPDAAAARAKADRLHARLLAGEDFAVVAREGSEAPSARYDGYVGWITQGRYARAWEDIAMSLPAGGVSSVVEIPEGFAILRATTRQESTIPPFEDMRERVLQGLLADDAGALSRRFAVFLKQLKAAESVTARPELVRVPPPPGE